MTDTRTPNDMHPASNGMRRVVVVLIVLVLATTTTTGASFAFAPSLSHPPFFLRAVRRRLDRHPRTPPPPRRASSPTVRNRVEAYPECDDVGEDDDDDDGDDADDSFFISASRDAYLERMRLLREGRTLAGTSYPSTNAGGNEADEDVVPSPSSSSSSSSSSVDDGPRRMEIPEGRTSDAMSGASGGGGTAAAIDDWGSFVVPDGTEMKRRTVTLAEALSIGDGMARESIPSDSSRIAIDGKEEEAEEMEMDKSEDVVVEVEEMEMEMERHETELDKEEGVTKVIDHVTEETTTTLDSDGTHGSNTPLGTTSHESSGAGDDETIMMWPESEETPAIDPQRQRQLSSDGKELFEPSQYPPSSSTGVNQDNVDAGLFVLTRTLFALKSVLDKD